MSPIYCQSESDLQSKEEIDSILIGTWKLKGSETDSQFVFSSSLEGTMICKVYQYLEKEDKTTNLIHETQVNVIEEDSIYSLKWDNPLFYWKGRIEKLKSNRLLVEINGNTLKFVKENE